MKFKGLSPAQVADSRKKYGHNILPMPAPKSAWYFFKQVFQDKINLILLIMLGLFAGLAVIGVGDIYEALGIAAVLLIVSVISVRTQLRAQAGSRELQRQVSRYFCRVIRAGRLQRLQSTDVVVGDIVLLSAGEIICADGYVVDGALAVNNAILNGESDDCDKRPVPGYRYRRKENITADDYTDINSVFAGTTVQSGTGVMRVTRIGGDTQNARILSSLNTVGAVKTSLQIQLDNMAAGIGRVGSLSAVVIFAVLVLTQYSAGDLALTMSSLRMMLGDLTVALTIFVAAVPEGLPFIISIIISRNTARMAKNHILPKNPQKIPAAGNLHIICTDKTGTLTRGQLSVAMNVLGDGRDCSPDMGEVAAVRELYAQSVVLNNGAAYDASAQPVGGNSTDRAVLSSVASHTARDVLQNFSVTRQIPFNSAVKYAMTTACKNSTGETITFVRGAPECVLASCRNYIDASGRVRRLNHTVATDIQKQLAAKSLRVVASAYVSGDVAGDKIPENMTLLAITAMRDELRPGVPDVIDMLHGAGIQVMMITGDNIDTARAIAADCGILTKRNDIVLNATDLDSHTDEWLSRHLSRIKVIARATPATKLRVISVAQAQNKSIGMCGDGTNDAPALRRADVGFAMGAGTDVAKEAGDIIITDNNFVSVANSVLIGRTFLHNVVSFLRFQLPINFSLVALCIAFPLLIGGEVLTAVQILIINIVMDSLNSLAFGGEAPRPEYMRTAAPAKGAPLLPRKSIIQIAVSTFIFLGLFAVMFWGPVRGLFAGAEYTGACFALLVIMAIFNGFNIRANGYNLLAGLRENPMFIFVALGVIGGCVMCVTFGGAALQVAPLNMVQWAVVFCLAAMVVPLDMMRKFVMRRMA